MSKTVLLGIYLKHIHRHMCYIGMGKMSVSVMTTKTSVDSLTAATHESNPKFHNKV